jgi:hypothetical protein
MIIILKRILPLLLLTIPVVTFCQQIDTTQNLSIQKVDSLSKVLDNQLQSHTNQINEKNTRLNDIDSQINSANTTIEYLKNSIYQLHQNKKNTESYNNSLKTKTDSLLQVVDSKDSLSKAKDAENTSKDSLLKAKDIALKSKDSLSNIKDQEISKKSLTSDSLQKAISAKLIEIEKLKDTAEVIGEICKYDSVFVYKTIIKQKDSTILKKDGLISTAIPLFKVKINSVQVSVKDAEIVEIMVNTNQGIFRNRQNIIDILHFAKHGGDHLYYEPIKYRKDADSIFVFLDDVISYVPRKSFRDVPYTNFQVSLNDSNKCHELTESTSINTYFNVAGFTDIKGISGEPNGIVQFTADARFILNTRNIWNSSLVFLNYITFHGGLSKFDNDFKGTQIINKDSISRKDLLQRANYSVGTKLNIFKVFPSPTPRFIIDNIELNAGYNFIGSKLYDTSIKSPQVIDTTFNNVTLNQFYIEPILVFNRQGNFAMTLSLPISFINVKKSAPAIKNTSLEYWATPGISLMYYPKQNSASKLFFRYNHFINLKDKTQAFSQLQLGLSFNLTDVWKSNQ